MSPPPYTVGWVYNLKTIPTSSDARGIIALAVVFPLLAILFVGFKFKIRWKTIGSVGGDDIALAISCGLNIGYSAAAIYQTKWGLGLNAADFPPENAVPFSRTQFAGGPLYCLTVLGFKLSLLISYLRVAGFNRTYATIVWVVMGSVIVCQILFTILLSAGCRPIAKQWDPSIPGTCLNALPIYFALGGTSLGWDLIIIILPFPILRRLHLDWQRKPLTTDETRKQVALLAVFSLGFFVTIVQAIRLTSIAKLATYTDSKGSIQWSAVEINLGVVVACVPTFGPLVKRWGQKVSRGSRSKVSKLAGSSRRKTNETRSRLPADMSRSWKGPTVAEDEIELWTSTNRIVGGASRMQSSAAASENDDDGKQSGSQSLHEQQIRVQRDVTVRLDEIGLQHI
ncbi:hypothetical protein E4T38_04714 [Aureobasidium subglaciale]|nr:hypothetical protein E4T38_04714 [Aureobasidium subglaciale]KAI5223108.1 hypothetical protein E4T40_04688 [Aureobasidium subglaciale]KAI5226732.1 hypothetical protein E4T41_04631 [Aureobasidium subglaciale]KAI5262454.1 hypothetical protein E4T46_04517 [Aureobasidium subglaciale]